MENVCVCVCVCVLGKQSFNKVYHKKISMAIIVLQKLKRHFYRAGSSYLTVVFQAQGC
jgi:hypothetical protein